MENRSGIKPMEYKVLILPENVEEKTEGGIIIPEMTMDKEKHAVMKGVLVASGAIAFQDPDWLDKPKPGDKVLYDRYAGTVVKGLDGVEYRLANDKEIGAVIYE